MRGVQFQHDSDTLRVPAVARFARPSSSNGGVVLLAPLPRLFEPLERLL
jgi:hypothetical protein